MDQPVNVNLQLTFSEPVVKGTGTITLTYNGNPGQSIDVSTLVLSSATATVTIDPPADLPVNTTISVNIPEGAFRDPSGNTFAGTGTFNPSTPWSFKTVNPDNTKPTATLDPQHAATGVAITKILSLTFSEAVKKGSGSITVSYGSTTNSIPLSSVMLSANGLTASFDPTPTGDLPYATTVSVTVPSGAFTDLANNPFDGTTGASGANPWSFTTASVPDTQAPTASLTPNNGATNQEISTNLVLTFNEAVQAGSGNISITDGITNQIIAVTDGSRVSFSVDRRTVTINPADFAYSATVAVTIPSGAFRDDANNAFAGTGSANPSTPWSFTTKAAPDTQAPMASLDPQHAATGVAITKILSLTFSEAVKKGTGNITVSYGSTNTSIPLTSVTLSANGLTASFDPTPTGDLPYSTAVSVTIPNTAFEDLAGNKFIGTTGASGTNPWSFTTVAAPDTQAPMITGLDPGSGATNVAGNKSLTVAFNEAVKKGSGSITINQGNTPIQTISVTDAAVSIGADQKTVTIDPADFPSGATLNVQITAGAFQDLANNNFAGITSATTWGFTIVDTQAPTAITFTPQDNATGVATNADLVLTFNEPVKKGNSGNITVNQGGTSQSIAVSSTAVSVSADGRTVTINPADFPSSAAVYVTIPTGTFTDLSNNNWAGISSPTEWNFTVADVAGPAISALSPPDNASNVETNANLVITFNEPVKKGNSGSITINQGGTVLQTIAVTDAAVSINQQVVTIDPADFPSGGNLNVQIQPGAFLDADNNTFAGITSADTWNFTVKDVVAPTATSLSPPDNSLTVAPNANLEITFSEPVRAGTGFIFINQGNLTQQFRVDDPAAPITIAGNKVTVNPADFPSGANVNVLISSGALTDLAGNAFAGITSADAWNFKVNDVNAPYVITFLPADNQENVSPNTNLVMTFSEPVKAGTGQNLAIVLTYGNTSRLISVPSQYVTINGNIVSIDPPSDLPSGANVNVTMQAGTFLDQENNPFPGITDPATWNFTISDVSAPTIASLSPADNAGSVDLNANLVMTFSEPVKKGVGKITINQGGTNQEIDVNDASVSINNNIVTINPADFPSGSAISITMPEGIFLDLNNIPFAGITNATTWNFTVKDTGVPVITALSPADDAANAATNANLTMAFSEPVKKGAGSITLNINGTSQTIDVNAGSVTVSNNTVTIDPADFPSGATVNVQMPAGIFTDLSGNPFAGITGPTAWNFSVGDVTVPTITGLSPADNAQNVGVKTNLEIRFSEAVKRGNTGFVLIDMGGGRQQVIPFDNPAIAINGDLVTVDPPNDLPYSTDVFVRIQAGTFTDLAGNAFEGISTNDRWNFRTMPEPDFNAPTFTNLSPGDNAVNVPVDVNLIITFNETVLRGEGKISVVYGSATVQIDVNDPQVTLSDRTVTIDLANNFPYNTGVSVQVPAGTFKDLAGNPFGGILSTTAWNFSVAPPPDAEPPRVSSFAPEDNANNVPPSANLTVIFNERIKKGSGLVIVNDGVNKQEISVSSDNITVSDNIVTINPPLDFPSSAGISIQISDGAFTDLSGNKYAGISDAVTWNFIVAASVDNTPPALVALSPADNAVNVSPKTDLTLSFSEPVKRGSGFIFVNQGGTVKSIDVKNELKVIIAGNTVTIKPDEFISGQKVSVYIPSSVFLDMADNSFRGINDLTSWDFTISDNVAPTLQVQYPADNAVGIPMNVNLMMIFDEEVQAGEGSVVITQNGNSVSIPVTDVSQISINGNTVVVNPVNNFPPNSSISVTMPKGAFKDRNGNSHSGILTQAEWNFETGNTVDNAPPLVSKLLPDNNKTNVPVSDDLVLTFNDVIQRGTGDIVVTINGVSQSIPVRSELVKISGNTVSINLPEDLPYLASIYITIPKGAFLDLANNTFSGFTDSGSWNFITTPVPPFSIVELNGGHQDHIDVTASQVIERIGVNKYPAGTKAELVYRGISETEWHRMPLTEKDLVIAATLERPIFDEIGLEYYFELTPDSAAPVRSKVLYTYLRYPNGMVLPEFRFGTTANDYQIISIPLNLRYPQIPAVFEDDMVTYKKNQWRFFHHGDSIAVEYKENNFFDVAAGLGYWLIVRDKKVLTKDTVDTGEGTTLQVTKEKPHEWQLKPGWNQIGNPYNFDISWEEVREFNNNPAALGNLLIFDRGYQESGSLKRMEGGFVFWDSQAARIKVPVIQNRAIGKGGRRSGEYRTAPAETSFWEVHFTLSSQEMTYKLGGLGMNPYASAEKDALDNIGTPRFMRYLDLRFSHPEHFAQWFAKDMVPVKENHQWEFTVASNESAQFVSMDWENFFTQQIPSGKKLVLFDLQNNQVVDLQQQADYRFWLDGSARFQVLYGSPEFVSSHLKPEIITFGPSAPNPLVSETVIPFSVPGDQSAYQVNIAVFDLQGHQVASLANGVYLSGVHSITWNGTGNSGTRVASGVYICRMTVHRNGNTQMLNHKILVH